MSIYEDVKLEDMRFDEDQLMYFYKCPCGDLFEISLEELHDGEDIALCPSCSLKLRVLYEESSLLPLPTEAPPDSSQNYSSPTEESPQTTLPSGRSMTARILEKSKEAELVNSNVVAEAIAALALEGSDCDD